MASDVDDIVVPKDLAHFVPDFARDATANVRTKAIRMMGAAG